MSQGARNLIILGLVATLLAFITTFISLTIYHNSGDIYLDRSRPGFLPDKEEAVKEADQFRFSDSGTIDQASLDEYLEHLKILQESLKELDTPYAETPLSDQSLGITAE
ncbi:hypothetical protein IKF76_00525 [Candidatus Saccharibacteria bacterium]|nr:hypothetical protein [Candidatus Saccharibacteria bacterium]